MKTIQFFFVHTLNNKHLDYFQFGAILCRPTNTSLFMDLCINFSTQGVKSLGHRIGVCLILLDLPKSLFPVVVPFYTLPAMFQSSGCSTSSPKFGLFNCFNCSHCGRCVVLSHCGINLHNLGED